MTEWSQATGTEYRNWQYIMSDPRIISQVCYARTYASFKRTEWKSRVDIIYWNCIKQICKDNCEAGTGGSRNQNKQTKNLNSDYKTVTNTEMKFQVSRDSHGDMEVLTSHVLVIAFKNWVPRRASPSDKTRQSTALKGTTSSYILLCFILFCLACGERKTLMLFKAFWF